MTETDTIFLCKTYFFRHKWNCTVLANHPMMPWLNNHIRFDYSFNGRRSNIRVLRISNIKHNPMIIWTNFRSPIQLSLHLKFGFDWPCGFGEDVSKWWTSTTDDGACLYNKLSHEPKGSDELKCNRSIVFAKPSVFVMWDFLYMRTKDL